MKLKLRSYGLFMLVVILLILGGLLLFSSVYNQPYIYPELLPTAEALLKSPITSSDWIKLNPPAGSTLQWGDLIKIDLHVFTVGMSSCKSPLQQEDDSFQGLYKYREWSIIFINGGRYKGFLGGSAVGTLAGGTLTIPVYALLLPGYHLFKIQPAGSQEEQNNPDPKLNYEWAYRVE